MSYFDPNALAQAHGYQHGRIEGERAGFRTGQEQGYDAGHTDGHALGYDKGWNDCVQVANGEMSKQMKFTQQHIAEKNLLQKKLTDGQQIIRQFANKLDEIEQENEQLKELIHSLRHTIQRIVAERK